VGTYLNPGNDGFKSIRREEYVDKSELIAFVNSKLNGSKKLICFSKPRRFGKSYAAKMLCAYYDRNCDSKELFTDLKIAGDAAFEKHLNQHDVIYLDITSFISRLKSLYGEIKDACKLIQSEVISELVQEFPYIGEEIYLPKALSKINDKEGRKFIILIDEWDALFREVVSDTDIQEEYLNLLRGLFKSDTTDKTIEAAYMTGILPIKKFGTQSALTDFDEFTMVNPLTLATFVGFTEAEVCQLCAVHNMSFEEMKRWYDGYSFDGIKAVYSPSSVMKAISFEEFGTYWTETETYESLKSYIEMDYDGLENALFRMLGGENVEINSRTFQNDMRNIKSRDDILTLLVHLGYLAYDKKSKSVRIPNEEIRTEFQSAITSSSKHTELSKILTMMKRTLTRSIVAR